METPAHAWHYTTSSGLISMLTEHRLWATSAAFMNDRDEILAGRQALQSAIEKYDPPLQRWQLDQLALMGVMKEGNPHNLFLLCASLNGDALTLWRSYGAGHEAEYAVDLDPSVPLLPVQQNDSDQHPEPVPPGWGDDATDYDDEGRPMQTYDPDAPYTFGGDWAVVEYLHPTSRAARAELDEIIKELQEPPRGRMIFPFFLDYLGGPDPTTSFKHPSFSDENEVRASWTVQPWWRFVLYRGGRFGITPYIEVGSSPRDKSHDLRRSTFLRPEQLGQLPIRSVCIGPTRAAAEARSTLRSFLDSHGYGNVEIVQSDTPYR